jgi:hypothetical protein
MQPLTIEIETEELIEKVKKDKSGKYFVQEAWVHTLTREGHPKRYPERVELYAPSDARGVQRAYKLGTYVVSAQSFRVQYEQLQLGFLVLEPVKKQTQQRA